ncbi:endonuclease/exonuclease/phosphatase family protein [Roseibium sp. RKSG952]|uniref:endonuclease/exonuclease/phosphatase family protein n=1 Tax=Roseibium sp. RKSG952 TaxID=2529384 RepID=UPI0012BBE7A6|nr:endonuclease/exonuclease/phosphatase family protein [Roseibium sp. RKSG952]MTH97674.1 hypothetical protein [Roseibium sp. RKSG952]
MPPGRLFLLRFLIVLWLVYAVCVLGALGAPLAWPLDLLAHFHTQLAIAGLIFLFAFLLARAWRLGLMALVLAVLSIGHVLVFSDRASVRAVGSEHSQRQFKAAAANLFGKLSALKAVSEQHENGWLDLAVLTELPSPIPELQAYFPDLPHVAGLPDRATKGRPSAIVLSRFPPHDIRIVPVGRNPAAIVRARYCPDSTTTCVTVFALHTPPPITRGFFERQRAIFHTLTRQVFETEGPVLVAGDLNAVSWSPGLRSLASGTGLKKVPCGGLARPTWLSSFWGAGLELDHFFVRGGATPLSCHLGPSAGSDHWPIIGTFALMRVQSENGKKWKAHR